MTAEIITADRQLLVFLLSSIMAMLVKERNMNPVLRGQTRPARFRGLPGELRLFWRDMHAENMKRRFELLAP